MLSTNVVLREIFGWRIYDVYGEFFVRISPKKVEVLVRSTKIFNSKLNSDKVVIVIISTNIDEPKLRRFFLILMRFAAFSWNTFLPINTCESSENEFRLDRLPQPDIWVFLVSFQLVGLPAAIGSYFSFNPLSGLTELKVGMLRPLCTTKNSLVDLWMYEQISITTRNYPFFRVTMNISTHRWSEILLLLDFLSDLGLEFAVRESVTHDKLHFEWLQRYRTHNRKSSSRLPNKIKK